jgi:AbrB family looped-hinge helix DNA binding protein
MSGGFMTKRSNPLAATVGDKGRVTLPENVRKHLGVEEGDVVLIELTANGTVELVPAALIPREQIWFAHPEVQARVAVAHQDIAAGRTTRVSKRTQLRTHLEKLKKAGRSD